MANTLEAKICVLGAQGVGKTSLVNRFVANKKPSSSTPSTVGASFFTKRTLDSETGIPLKLQIWDTAGQERFRSIAKLYYRGASAVILVYSITSKNSFLELKKWMAEVREQLGSDVLVHVVGTMSDLVQKEPDSREVEMETVISYIAETLFETKNMSIGMDRSVSRRGRAATLNAVTPPVPGTALKRHSAFGWETGLGWDICHEISSESGEGIDEVFRVVTRKLVDQYVKQQEREIAASTAITPFSESGHPPLDYFGRSLSGGGGTSRIGAMVKRRSWLGLSRNPSYAVDAATVDITQSSEDANRRGCC